jgi:predicted anti-sigma-YlaC factor YlaD
MKGRENRHRSLGDRGHGEPCAAARETISALIDGEASELERAHVARHLEWCDSCRAFDADARRVAKTLRAAPLVRAARSLVPVRRPRRQRLPLTARVAGSVAAVAMVAVLGAVVSGRIERPTERPPAPELRVANLDTRQAQREFHLRQVEQLLHVPAGDRLLDRQVQLQRLG